ncbi:alpha/beta fold hydrolase [bacterium]|nr:alpha/beta fold hydrolase [bacterium]
MKRRMWRWGILVLMVAGLLKSMGCALGRQALAREETRWARNPETGVIVGAESKALGDPGSATAVLLLHGFIGSVGDFNQLGERLAAEGHFVRAPLLPGHGTRPQELAEVTADDLRKAARDEFDRLASDHECVFVVGFSMGGSLATLLAAERPVDRLVLIAPYYDVSHRWYYVLPPHVWNHLVGGMFDFLPKYRPFICVNRKEARGAWPTYGAVGSVSVRMIEELGRRARDPEILAKITMPVLHLHAARDRVSSPRAARKVIAQIPAATKEQVWYTRSNHILLWDYDADDVEKRVVEFLR